MTSASVKRTRTSTTASTRRRAGIGAGVSATRPATVRKRRTSDEVAKAKRRSEATHARHILATYGITADEYLAIYEYQGGRCALCRRATGKTRRLAVDHCHATGRVRGLCCKFCNRLLGFARDSAEFFRRCAAYLESPPAFAVIGERVVPDHDRAVYAGPEDSEAGD